MGLLSFLFFIGVVGNRGVFGRGERRFFGGKGDARIGKAPHIYVYIRLTHRFRWGVPPPIPENVTAASINIKNKIK